MKTEKKFNYEWTVEEVFMFSSTTNQHIIPIRNKSIISSKCVIHEMGK